MKLFSNRKAARDFSADSCFEDGRRVRDVLKSSLNVAPSEIKRLNHRGLLSLKVKAGDGVWKVAECASVTRARSVARAMGLVHDAGGPVPPVTAVDGAVVTSPWVEGTPLLKESEERQRAVVLECQRALYDVAVGQATQASDYLHLEWLFQKLWRIGPGALGRNRVSRLEALMRESLPPEDDPRILHPDLTPANIVLAEKGPVIIDNEAMGVGSGVEFDIWNSGEALCGHRNRTCIEVYVSRLDEYIQHPRLWQYEEVWDRFRLLRRMLKSIEKKRYIKCWGIFRSLIKDFE